MYRVAVILKFMAIQANGMLQTLVLVVLSLNKWLILVR